MPQTITVIIKAANQQSEDVSIACQDDWTVKALKEHLSVVHPNRPSVDKQRLIYSGQLLGNASKLVTVIREDDEHKIVHLVCPASASSSVSPPNAAASAAPEATRINDAARHRFQPEPQQCNALSSMSAAQQQLLCQEYLSYLQQHYYQQLWAQYMSSQGLTPPGLPAVTTVQPQLVASAPVAPPAAQQPNPAPAGAGVVAANAMGNDGADADGGGGLAMDDQAVTLADWLSIALRTFCVSLIMYYYSSMDKAVLSFVIFMLIMVIQAGYLDFVHGWFRRAADADVAADVDGAPAALGRADDAAASLEEPAAPASTPPVEGSAAQQPQLGYSFAGRCAEMGLVLVRTVVTFVVTFFTSLVPERAPRLDVE